MRPGRCKRPLGTDVCGLDAGHEGECGKPWRPWQRGNYVPAPHYYALNQACTLINRAFNMKGHCYLVGSALDKRDYRDVDVRFIMDDDEYARLFKAGGGQLDPLWTLICLTTSKWLSEHSDLPIDFQIQQQSHANHSYEGERHPLGYFAQAQEDCD